MGGGGQQKQQWVAQATMEKGKNPSPEREGTTEVGVQAIITYKLLHCSSQYQQTGTTPQMAGPRKNSHRYESGV